MKHLSEYIIEQKEYNKSGFSNYFEKSDDFIEALNSNSVFFKKIFHLKELNSLFIFFLIIKRSLLRRPV